jgi:hypothetical protein
MNHHVKRPRAFQDADRTRGRLKEIRSMVEAVQLNVYISKVAGSFQGSLGAGTYLVTALLLKTSTNLRGLE